MQAKQKDLKAAADDLFDALTTWHVVLGACIVLVMLAYAVFANLMGVQIDDPWLNVLLKTPLGAFLVLSLLLHAQRS